MEEKLDSELFGLNCHIPKDPTAAPSPNTSVPLLIGAGTDSNSGKIKLNPPMLTTLMSPKHKLRTHSITPVNPHSYRDGPGLATHNQDDRQGAQPTTRSPHQMPLLCGHDQSRRRQPQSYPACPLARRRPHPQDSKAAQNATYTEGIDDTTTNIYGKSTHFLGHASHLHSDNYTELQVSHTEHKNSTLLTPNLNPNTCTTTQTGSHNPPAKTPARPSLTIQSL